MPDGRHTRNTEIPAAPISLPDGGPSHRLRTQQDADRHQERHVQRTDLYRAFSAIAHFPGVLILEAMAQASALLAFKSMDGYPSEKTLYLLVGIDKARFKRQVIPGDQLVFDASVLKERRGIWRFEATAKVDGVLVSSAEVLIARNELDE